MLFLSADSNNYRDISIQMYVTNLTPIKFCASFMDRNVTTDWIDVTFWCNLIGNSLELIDHGLAPLYNNLSERFKEYNYTKIFLGKKSVSGIWICEWESYVRMLQYIWRWRPTVEFRVLVWMVCRRIKGTECKQLQVAMCETVCVCMYSYFIALITN